MSWVILVAIPDDKLSTYDIAVFQIRKDVKKKNITKECTYIETYWGDIKHNIVVSEFYEMCYNSCF